MQYFKHLSRSQLFIVKMKFNRTTQEIYRNQSIINNQVKSIVNELSTSWPFLLSLWANPIRLWHGRGKPQVATQFQQPKPPKVAAKKGGEGGGMEVFVISSTATWQPLHWQKKIGEIWERRTGNYNSREPQHYIFYAPAISRIPGNKCLMQWWYKSLVLIVIKAPCQWQGSFVKQNAHTLFP